MTTTQESKSRAAAARREQRGLGERVRQLRSARGLTQAELGGERVTKEYISQIELGKARPTEEMIAWLAERLEVDAFYLETGASSRQHSANEALIARAEAAVAAQSYDEAVEVISTVRHSPEAPEHELRALCAESWARMYLGEVRPAIALLERARALVEAPPFGDLERADVLYRLAACRYKLSSISTAVALFSEALTLAERSGLPCDALRSDILARRARCYRRQRDWEAAREDIERALELARGLEDRLPSAHAYFQASIVAERSGNWLRARAYAEQAKTLYEVERDRLNVGRLLNNLGGLNFLLGRPDTAIGYLKDAFRVALELGSEVDAAQAVSSLAQVNLRQGDAATAEGQARHAIELLRGRVDFVDELGNAQLVLGRALMEEGRLDEADGALAEAETTLSQLSSASHRAAAWTARGDLATRRDDHRTAAALYRRAAEALQDVRF